MSFIIESSLDWESNQSINIPKCEPLTEVCMRWLQILYATFENNTIYEKNYLFEL